MIENTQRGSNRLFIRNVDLDEANQLIKVSHIEKLFICTSKLNKITTTK